MRVFRWRWHRRRNKKTAARVQKMLIKSRAEGGKKLRMEDRFFLQTTLVLDVDPIEGRTMAAVVLRPTASIPKILRPAGSLHSWQTPLRQWRVVHQSCLSRLPRQGNTRTTVAERGR